MSDICETRFSNAGIAAAAETAKTWAKSIKYFNAAGHVDSSGSMLLFDELYTSGCPG
jgi:hypothetical protein